MISAGSSFPVKTSYSGPDFSEVSVSRKRLRNAREEPVKDPVSSRVSAVFFDEKCRQALDVLRKNKRPLSFLASLKTKPRLEVGYAMHWHIIKSSLARNYKGYNISVGGPEGVERFKDDFGREIVLKSKSYVGIFK
jgi:hypothetical protein